MTSLVDIEETVLRRFSSLTFGKNKILDKSTEVRAASEPPKILSSNGNLLDQEISTSSQHFEAIIVTFVKISYFLGIAPYQTKIIELHNEKVVESSSSRLHMVIVIIVHVCTVTRFIFRLSQLSYNVNNPVNYFSIARTVLSASSCMFFLWSLWMRHHKCEALLNRLANFNCYQNTTTLRRKWVQVVLFIICIGLLLITSLYRTIVESGKHMEEFCKHNRYGQQIICNNGKHKHLKILALQILYVLGNTMARNTRRLPRLEFLIIALTLWQLCKSFSRSIRRRNEYHALYQNHEVMLILSAYEELKEISNLICILIGETLVSEIVEDIVYFSLEVQLSIRSADWFGVLVIFETWITAFLAYFIAANAAEHIQTVNVWLARDDVLSKLSPGKITILSAQLAAHPIGLKGGSLFTITKGFLANVVTVWVTYFIILLQFYLGLDENVKTTDAPN